MSETYRSYNLHIKSLEYAKLLVDHVKIAKDELVVSNLIALGEVNTAIKEIKLALKKFPNHFNLLIAACRVYDVSGEHDKFVKYSKELIEHHANAWQGYVLLGQKLIKLKKGKDAQKEIQMGLRKLPDNSKINIVAHNIYKFTGEHEKSLEYAMRIIAHYPDAWEDMLTAQSLID